MKALVLALLVCGCASLEDDGRPTPLRFESNPAGATAEVTLRSRVLRCVTPCELSMPEDSTFQIRVTLAGHELASPLVAPRWKFGLLGDRLEPSTMTAEFVSHE